MSASNRVMSGRVTSCRVTSHKAMSGKVTSVKVKSGMTSGKVSVSVDLLSYVSWGNISLHDIMGGNNCLVNNSLSNISVNDSDGQSGF